MIVNNNENISVSFLVPTLGERKEELIRLLNSLSEQIYDNVEVIISAQDNFETVRSIIEEYNNRLKIRFVRCESKGLSKARNVGLSACKGPIIVLSDDDCWYPKDASQKIVSMFSEDEKLDVMLSKIYDKTNQQDYKSYSPYSTIIRSPFKLSSKSSIEIAFRNKYRDIQFDELFGLGGHFVCCEEVDFLLQLFRKHVKIEYFPIVTVYHIRKSYKSTSNQVRAKGAFYCKNYNPIVGFMICTRDLVLKRENTFKEFYKGYHEYRNFKRRN